MSHSGALAPLLAVYNEPDAIPARFLFTFNCFSDSASSNGTDDIVHNHVIRFNVRKTARQIFRRMKYFSGYQFVDQVQVFKGGFTDKQTVQSLVLI